MRSNWFCKYKMAHRGLHNTKYPENSLGAFQNAVDFGCAIELDARLLKDNTVVVFHDTNLLRMCGVDIELNELTKEQLKDYKLLNSKYTIPTLLEVLDLVSGRVPIMLELKPLKAKYHIEKKVYDIIKDYKGDIAVKSFNPLTMMWFKRHAPNILRGILSCNFSEDSNHAKDYENLPKLFKSILRKMQMFKFVKPDFISFNIDDLPSKYVTKRNVPILAWVINSKDEEGQAYKLANSIIFEGYIPDSPTNY